MDNQSTPTSDSGLGASAPSTSSSESNTGFAQNSTPTSSTDSGLGGHNNTGDYSTLEKRFQDTQRAYHQSQSQLTEYQKQMQQLEAKVQGVDQLKQALAQGLGFAEQNTQPDILDNLVNDPNYLQSVIDSKVNEALAPFQQQQEYVELEKYTQQQALAKQEYISNLKDQYGEEFAKEMSDVNDIAGAINPRINELKQLLGDPSNGIPANPMLTQEQKAQLNSELSKLELQAVQSVGGIQNLQKIKLADFVLKNMDSLASQFYQRKQQRAQGYGAASGFGQSGTGGASTYNHGDGSSGFSVTSIQR